jgi:splicing factor 4
VIDGGTWEHRKRAKEMLETAAKNLELTAMAAGRHHIADFLPVSEE